MLIPDTGLTAASGAWRLKATASDPRRSHASPRLARVVVPLVPHHVTQRGNRRQQTFFSAADYALYRNLVAEFCANAGVEV